MRPVVAIAVTLLLLGACVPEPPNRSGASGGGGAGSATAPAPTPVPTPVWPTPTPSFVRPTPTPQPTFVVYMVVRGDTMSGIARKFGTTRESIAYWNRVEYPSLDPESSSFNPNLIRVGWMLNIIPNVVIDPEDLPTLPPGG